MNSRFRRVSLALIALICGAVSAAAEEATPGRPLLSAKVDERQMVTLAGNTRPEAKIATNDRAAVADSLPLEHIHLQLRRSPAQERAVETFVNSLTDSASPNYHHWLTAAEFGKHFGVADSDVARIAGWLRTKGLTVNFVYPSRMVIDFSGTAGQVSRAFNTEIHHLDVDGATHLANIRDPQIPAALAPAVEGIVSLHDFGAHNKIAKPRPGARPDATGNCNGTACYDVTPGDLATIYGLKTLFAQGYTGEGQVIATVEDTNLFANSDWTTFRKVFALNTIDPKGNLLVVHPAPKGGRNCGNPGTNNHDGEATLDVEWASAAAPGATIELASCAQTSVNNGIYLAAQNLVNGTALPSVISVSYGICEADDGAAENASFNKLYQQAAAEGISVFVATGDNGPTDCYSSGKGTTVGIGINGWASSQYDVAVGGTDFRDTFDGKNATYWSANAGAPWSTAKSYVPEIPWNDTCANGMIASYYGGTTVTYGSAGFCNTRTGASFLLLGGGEGGPSRCYSGASSGTSPDVISGTCKGYPKPTWQKGFLGMPGDGVRDVPDVSLFASDGSAWNHNYATCFTDQDNDGGPCTGNPVLWAANAGGTSYATPIMAAIQALVDQYTGVFQGNPSPTYYKLAASQYGAKGNAACSADKGNAVSATCIFHDIVSGDSVQDCRGTVDCYRPSGTYGVLSTVSTAYEPAYKATVGYDLATGIGSVNAYNLAKGWPK